uniref:FF domain-containing protein n=1 Tax=Haemonchus placei TaxID=6290 RepID=A0A0N4WW20_HAEPC
LPTRESEWLHRNDPVWEYGFYEPEEKRIPKNKLMFREALEVLRARQEIEDDSDGPNAAKMREEARKVYEEHKAVARVDPEKLDEMWEYFRPFVRKDTQKVRSEINCRVLPLLILGYEDFSYILSRIC